jgi:hypothetical protein
VSHTRGELVAELLIGCALMLFGGYVAQPAVCGVGGILVGATLRQLSEK